MPKLTKKVVDGAMAGAAQILVWDSDVKGFGLRVTPAGAKSYILNYRNAAGQSRRYTIGKHGSPWTCEQAREKATAVLRDLAAGVDPLEVKGRTDALVVVDDLIQLYLKDGPEAKPGKKAISWTSNRSCFLRHVSPLLGRKPVTSVTKADVERMQSDIAKGKTSADVKTKKQGRAIVTGGNVSAANSVRSLSAAYNFAIGRELLVKNPAKGVKLLKGASHERFLTDREMLAIAEAMAALEQEDAVSAVMIRAIRALALTACRKGEIIGLRWEWVDLGRNCLRLPDSKTGKREIPLASAAVELVASLPRTSPWVFPSSRNDGHIMALAKTWAAVKARAVEIARRHAVEAGENPEYLSDLSTVRMHDLRHSFASFAVSDGASLFIVGKVLGHKRSSTTEIYAHLRNDPLKAVVDQTGAKIADAFKTGADRAKAAGPREVAPKRAVPVRKKRKAA